MKLSVKIIAGLAVLAIAVVAIVGSSSDSKAATGSIFVANEYSKVTNLSPAPSGYTTRSTVFSTYPGTGRLIQTDADLVKVIVTDSELNEPVERTATGTLDEININNALTVTNSIGATPAGSTIIVNLVGAGTSAPIAGDLSHVQANTSIVGSSDGELNGDEVTISNFFAGSISGDPWMLLTVNTALGAQTIDFVIYDTAPIGYATVTVKSELNPTGVTLTAEETAVGSGTFVGYVRLLDNAGTPLNGSPGWTPGSAAEIQTNVGPVTASFVDSNSSTRSTTVSIDTQAPVVTATSPVNGSATTNHRPTFSGTIAEAGAGLHVDTIAVWIDQDDDQLNGAPVWDPAAPTGYDPVTGLKLTALDLDVSTSGAVDGDSAFSFSDEPSVDLPLLVASPDHIVDWVAYATDLAGNTGVVDTDPTDVAIDLPTVKIDQTDPNATSTASDHRTGLWWDGEEEVSTPVGIRLGFLDNLTNVQASDFAVTLDSGAVRTPLSVIVVNNASGFTVGSELLDPISLGTGGVQSLVYLEMPEALASNETPFVVLQDIVSDEAGNFIDEFLGFVDGEAPVQDGIAPNLTVTLSGGSGVGSGSEGPSGLTADEMKITIESDESLSLSPTVHVFNSSSSVTPEVSPLALGQGANTWVATYTVPGGPVQGDRVVMIESIDLASNSGTTGSSSTSSTSAPKFEVDTVLATPDLIVGGGDSTTDQTRPALVVDYGAGSEKSTVTLMKVTLDGADITNDVVPASDGKRFFYIPPMDLSLGDHELVIASGDAHDAAGNTGTKVTLDLTVEERNTFNISVFAGWNAVSFPSDPIDPDINSVFNNVGHDAVLGWDPSVPGGWTVAVRDTVSGMLEPASEGGLTSVRSTQAYWVHANNFEDVKTLLVGETLPGAGSPPGIVMIETVPGFNAIPVVDTDRKQTTGDAGTSLLRTPSDGGSDIPVTVGDYFGGNQGRVYKWNPATLNFELAESDHAVNTGEVLFAEIPGGEPIFP